MVRDADRQPFVDPETGVKLARAEVERQPAEGDQHHRDRPGGLEDVGKSRRANAFGDRGHCRRRDVRARSTARPTTVIGTKSTKRSTSRYPSEGSLREPSASRTAASNVPTYPGAAGISAERFVSATTYSAPTSPSETPVAEPTVR